MTRPGPEAIAAVLGVLDRGGQPDEPDLVRALRSPHCPGALLERLAGSRWVLASRRLLPLVAGHPACPRHFALESLPRLSWRDLVAVAATPRTPPPVRRQAERKLVARLPLLTLGERVALARIAPRPALLAMLGDADALCIEAMLDNPRLTETDVVRIMGENRQPGCALLVLRHRRWGLARAVRHAAVRSAVVPLGVAMGVLATFSSAELAAVVRAGDVPAAVQAAARELLARRPRANDEADAPPPPCTPAVTP